MGDSSKNRPLAGPRPLSSASASLALTHEFLRDGPHKSKEERAIADAEFSQAHVS